MSDKAYLKYLGGRWLHGVPARNLTEKEAIKHGVDYLLDTGLYELIDKQKPAKRAKRSKTCQE